MHTQFTAHFPDVAPSVTYTLTVDDTFVSLYLATGEHIDSIGSTGRIPSSLDALASNLKARAESHRLLDLHDAVEETQGD